MKTKTLPLKDYWEAVGPENMQAVLEAAGMRPRYAGQIKLGFKVPGRLAALSLIDAAREVTPGWEPDLEAMLRQELRRPAKKKKTKHAAVFLKSRKQAA